MRIEYNFELGDCEIPCFSVEATEGPHKLFQLSTLVLNMLDEKDRVDVVFHSPNRGDLPRKVEAYKTILTSAPHAPEIEFEDCGSGSLAGYYYCWVSIHSTGARASG